MGETYGVISSDRAVVANGMWGLCVSAIGGAVVGNYWMLVVFSRHR